jgi:cysteinyl-tRNA synthetase
MLLTLARSFSRSHLGLIVQPTARSLCSHSFPLRRAMASTQDASSRSKAIQDSWILPTRATEEPKLKVYNSLTRTKVSCSSSFTLKRADLRIRLSQVDFVTKKPGVVTWYNCGPTVYDASHMGHAR